MLSTYLEDTGHDWNLLKILIILALAYKQNIANSHDRYAASLLSFDGSSEFPAECCHGAFVLGRKGEPENPKNKLDTCTPIPSFVIYILTINYLQCGCIPQANTWIPTHSDGGGCLQNQCHIHRKKEHDKYTEYQELKPGNPSSFCTRNLLHLTSLTQESHERIFALNGRLMATHDAHGTASPTSNMLLLSPLYQTLSFDTTGQQPPIFSFPPFYCLPATNKVRFYD